MPAPNTSPTKFRKDKGFKVLCLSLGMRGLGHSGGDWVSPVLHTGTLDTAYYFGSALARPMGR